jgi:hypothetical protein
MASQSKKNTFLYTFLIHIHKGFESLEFYQEGRNDERVAFCLLKA